MKVSKRVLLFLAGIVWTAAGFNVLRIRGTCLSALSVDTQFSVICGSVCTFLAVCLWKAGQKTHSQNPQLS